jgi:hypothetical protein
MAEIPLPVKDFVSNYIHSLSELEILLFLRDNGTARLASDSIGKALLMHSPAVEPRLGSLCSSGLVDVTEEGGIRWYQYAPFPCELAQLVDQLAKWYRSHPVAITTLIFSKPVDNMIRGFANSFRFRKAE